MKHSRRARRARTILRYVTAGGVGGVAALGGTLNVTIANGFSPTNGATFAFLTAVSRVGAFATFNYPSNDIGMVLSYDATSAKVTVSNLKPVVTNPISNPAPVTYGSVFNFQFPANTFTDPDNNALTYTATGVPPGLTFVGATRTFSGTPSQAGTFPVTVTANDNGSPSLAMTNTFTVTVNPATLSIAAEAKTKNYGAIDPVLTYTVSGLQFGDLPASVLTGALVRSAGETVAGGAYAITQGTLAANDNYTISFTGSSLTITKAALSIAADAKTKIYGAADPANSATYSGFVLGETSSVLGGTLAFTRAPGENVGSYPITPTGLTSGNYTITFNTGSLSITKAALSVTAAARTKIYGVADPVLTFTTSGLQFNDTAGTVLTGALTRTAGETVAGSPYAITQGTLAPNGNYTVNFTGGSLTITKAALSITTDTRTKTYGAADPAFTVSYSGFVNSETPAVLGGTLAFTRTPGTIVGNYPVTPGGLTSGNYTITFNTGLLSITKAALSVTADAKTKTYGATDPVFTATYSGFVLGETSAVLGGTLSFARAPGENVGSYLISPSGLTSGNYVIIYDTGTLTITAPAPLMLPPALIGKTNVIISWNSVSNARYRVQFKPALNATSWTDLAGDVTATGNLSSKTDIETATNRFYRIQVLP